MGSGPLLLDEWPESAMRPRIFFARPTKRKDIQAAGRVYSESQKVGTWFQDDYQC